MRGRLLYVVSDRLSGRAVVPALDAMLARQAWSSASLLQETRHRAAAIVRHAVETVPYYRDRGPRGAAELDALPLLSRADLQGAGATLRAPGIPDAALERTTSGGSTGDPVSVWLDRVTLDAQTAGVLRCQTWMGLDLVERHALLWGPPADVVTYGTLRGRLRGAAIRRTFFPTFGLDDDGVGALRRALEHGDFPLVIGYSSALDRVAAGAAPLSRPTRAVVASAEPLFPAQRRRIERYFGAPVFERYGCNEFAAIAHQCRRGGRHVLSDRVALEILDRDGRPAARGSLGEAVATDLDNRAMPLVRYRLGDALEPDGSCPCGLPFPVIGPVHGRTADLIETSGGRRISPRHVAIALEPCGETLEHQVRLGPRGAVCLVRPLGGFDAARAEASLSDLLERKVRVEATGRIDRWPSGKVRPVVHEVAA